MAKRVSDEERLARYFDEDGKLSVFPSKRKLKDQVLERLASKFSEDIEYSEAQINDIINDFQSFGDHVLLRRELIDARILKRHKDGSAYWKMGSP